MSENNPILAKHYDVFLSYKREDDDARAALCDALEKRGYVVFWDGKLGVDLFRKELRERLNQCKLTIVLWSAKAARSDEVKDEASAAKHMERLMSVHIEDKAVIPSPFRELNRKCFEAWNEEGSTRDEQFAKILDTVDRVTGGPSRAPIADVSPVIPVDLINIPAARQN